MSVLVVGLSHRTAPLSLLERASLDAPAVGALGDDLRGGDHVAEAVVLATCNRLEVYADVSKFHGGVADVSAALAARTGVPLDQLVDHLYVHYEDRAVAHLFAVACGLDSMAVGESQILGQVRRALRHAQQAGTAGRVLDLLLQQALRVGKRAHSETGLDRAGTSLVEAGLRHATAMLGPLGAADVLVVGAGAMSALAATTVERAGARRITVANRTLERAQRLAGAVGGEAVELADRDALVAALATADVVVSCTGAVGHALSLDLVVQARRRRGGIAATPQVLVDLALPRDVAPEVAELPGIVVVDLDRLGRDLAGAELGIDLADVRGIVADEVAGYLAVQRAEAVAPTVVALRSHAREVVEAELARLVQRLPETDERTRAELAQTVHRVVEKLLHTPTVRVKQLAEEPGGLPYADALRELFDLDLHRVAAVTEVELQATGTDGPGGGAR